MQQELKSAYSALTYSAIISQIPLKIYDIDVLIEFNVKQWNHRN